MSFGAEALHGKEEHRPWVNGSLKNSKKCSYGGQATEVSHRRMTHQYDAPDDDLKLLNNRRLDETYN